MPHGVVVAVPPLRTGLTREQVKAAIPVVLAMRRPVRDVDAALDLIGTRRLHGADPAAQRRCNGL